MPVTTIAIAALLAVIPRFEPRRANLERSGKAYGAIWITVVTLLGGVHVLTVAAALGADLEISRLVLIGTGLLFVVIGNYLPKVRPNYLMGIRTPWTLASDLSWTRTHRLGGRLFVIEGLVLARPRPARRRAGAAGRHDHRRDRGAAGHRVRLLVPGLEGRPGEAVGMSDVQILLLLLPVIAIQIGLLILALRDLLRPDRKVRGDSKLMWGLIVVFIGLLGPILYFAVGREDR